LAANPTGRSKVVLRRVIQKIGLHRFDLRFVHNFRYLLGSLDSINDTSP
jgi:hypothetical protein